VPTMLIGHVYLTPSRCAGLEVNELCMAAPAMQLLHALRTSLDWGHELQSITCANLQCGAGGRTVQQRVGKRPEAAAGLRAAGPVRCR
jgi:hypothetical protein